MTEHATPKPHTDRAFERDLQRLRERLSSMSATVEDQISASMKALTGRDATLARAVIDGDTEVNRRELEIDELCRRILALRQPAASDLRLITTALKIVTDLERIGDLAVNIAERAVDLARAPALPVMPELLQLAAEAEAAVKQALRAFVDADALAADAVVRGDERVDALFVNVLNALLALMMEDSRTVQRASSLMFVARHLERIGDHATNIAEMTVYMVKGTDIRHPHSLDHGAAR